MPDNRNVAIFWDYENCSPPLSSHGYAIVDSIRRIAHVLGSVTAFKTYLDLSAQTSRNSVIFRSQLQSSGVSIIDCPHNGKKEVVDKMILVDMLAFALDHKSPATVILIAGDRDYAYALSTLRFRRYSVILIVPSLNAPQSLQSQASVVVDWNYAILGKRPDADTPPLRQIYRDFDDDTIQRLSQEILHSSEDPAVTLMSSSHLTTTAPTHTRRDSTAEPLESSAYERNIGLSNNVQPVSSLTLDTTSSVPPETPGRSRVRTRTSRPRSTTQSTQAVPDIDRGLGSPFTMNNALLDGSAADEYVSTANAIQDAPQCSLATLSSMSPRLERFQNIVELGSPPIVNHPASSSPFMYNLGSRTVPLSSPSHSRTISGGTPVSYSNSYQRSASAAILSSPVSSGRQNVAAPALNSSNTNSVSSIMDDAILPSDDAAVRAALGLDSDEDNSDNDSPLLAEVGDSLRAYATNVVEPRFNANRTSFDSFTKSPPANDASPLTESYGTPTSQMSSLSSLSPSIPDSSVIVPNVETGSSRAKSVISDNSNDHSSDYQAPGFESIENKIRRLTPRQFLPLINQLLLARSKGIDQVSRSIIADALRQQDKDVFKHAGANRFSDYTALAEQAALIVLGGREGQAWIGLHPKWFKERTMPQSPTPSSARTSTSSVPRHNVKSPASFTTTILPPSFAPPATIPNPSTSPPADVSDEPIPICFFPLVRCLVNVQKGGMEKPYRSAVGLTLGPTVYEMAGVSTLKEYLALAVDNDLVELGGADGHAWVRLHPDILSGRRPF